MNYLTQSDGTGILPLKTLKKGGFVAKGTILCVRCRRKSDTATCVCGNETFFVDIYWAGKNYTFRRNAQKESMSRKEAQDLLVEINRQIKKGIFDPAGFEKSRELFQDIFGQYVEYVERRVERFKNSPGWLRNLKGYWKNYYSILDYEEFASVNGKSIGKVWKLVQEGTKVVGHDNKGDEIREPITSNTMGKIMSAGKSFYKWVKAQPWGASLEVPPFPIMEDDDGEDSRDVGALDEDARAAIIANLSQAKCTSCRPEQRGRDAGHSAPHEFMREVGIRESEVCLVRVGNIVWDNGLYGEFWIDEHLVAYPGKGWTIWPGLKSSRRKKKKHERDGRWVQMTPRAAEVARENAEGKTGDAFLFINPMTGMHYMPDALYRAFKNHSGTEGTSPHPAWVHSFVTDVMENGTSVEDAVILTGKSSKTLDKYDNPRRRRQRDIMSRVLNKKIVSIHSGHGSEMEVKKKGGSQ